MSSNPILNSLEMVAADPLPAPLTRAAVAQNEESWGGETYSLSLSIALAWEGEGRGPERIVFTQKAIEVEEIRFDPDTGEPVNVGVPFERTEDTLSVSIRLNLLSLASNGSFEISAQFPGKTPASFCEVKLSRRKIELSPSPKYTPLLLDAMTSSGTTFFMKLLMGHPQIVVHDRYPYEFCLASYWWYMLEALSSPVNPGRSFDRTDPREIRAASRHVPTPPYYDDGKLAGESGYLYLGRNYVEKLANFCAENIDSFYQLQDSGPEDNQDAERECYFIEKWTRMPFVNSLLVRELYPEAKRIFIFRDIRDKISSTVSREMRHETVKTPEAIAAGDCATYNAHFARYQADRERSLMLRYEDLVKDVPGALESIFDYLGIAAGDELIADVMERAEPDSGDMTRHRTSASVDASIGRYATDLDPALIALCEAQCGDVLTELGYR